MISSANNNTKPNPIDLTPEQTKIQKQNSVLVVENQSVPQIQSPSVWNKLNQNIQSLKSKYDQYQAQKKQKMFTFPQPKQYPSKPHQMNLQQLRTFNFSKLSQQQIKILDDLSTFTPHRQFVKMLTNRYSDMKKKQHFIKDHSAVLSSDQFSQFNRAKFDYQKNSRTFAAFCTGTLSLAGFMIGLYVLPSRKGPWKYTFVGLGVGIGLSYGFWRMQIFKYHNRMNQQFKTIIRDKYQAEKKSQRIRASLAA